MSQPEAVRHFFRQQSQACAKLGSPFMGRLMALMAERLTEETEVGAQILNWAGDPSPAADNPSLRLAGGLHALVLQDLDPGLTAAYPPHGPSDDALWRAVSAALVAHEAALLGALGSAPQTNEVRRAAGVVPALHLLAEAVPGTLHLWEVGCSAGLNLVCDQFAITAGAVRYGPKGSPVAHAPDWEGAAPRVGQISIGQRRGVDLNPIDVATEAARLRLLSYLWPDQPHRRALTLGAIALQDGAEVALDREDAVAWLRRSLPDRPGQGTTVLFHTVAWQYLPPEAKAAGEAAIAEAGAQATAASPLARIAFEADGRDEGAGLSLTMWPGGVRHDLARVDFHGRWVRWLGPTTLV